MNFAAAAARGAAPRAGAAAAAAAGGAGAGVRVIVQYVVLRRDLWEDAETEPGPWPLGAVAAQVRPGGGTSLFLSCRLAPPSRLPS